MTDPVPIAPPHQLPGQSMDMFHGDEQPLQTFQQGGAVGNFDEAKRKLFLSPQEQNAYKLHLHNLWSDDGYSHPDGGRSSYYMTPHEENGRHYALPGVAEGRLLSRPESVDRARTQGLDNFPSYGSYDELSKRYGDLHGYMEKDTNDWERVRSGPLQAGETEITEGYAQGGRVQGEGEDDRVEPTDEERARNSKTMDDIGAGRLKVPEYQGRDFAPRPVGPQSDQDFEPRRTKIQQQMDDPEHGAWHDDSKYQIYTPHPSFFAEVDPRDLVAHFDKHHPEDHKLNLP